MPLIHLGDAAFAALGAFALNLLIALVILPRLDCRRMGPASAALAQLGIQTASLLALVGAAGSPLA
jgi:hypothetical protein